MGRKLATVNASAEGFSAASANNISTAAFTPGGVDRLLFAFVAAGSGAPAFATECRWGGATGDRMDEVARIGMTNWRLQLFMLRNPQSKSDTVRAAWAASHDERVVVAVAVENADVAMPFIMQTGNLPAITATQSVGTTDPTINVTSEVDALVIDCANASAVSSDAGCTIAVGAGQNSIQEQEGSDLGGFALNGVSWERATGSPTTMSWDVTHSSSWEGMEIAIAIRGADDRPKGRMWGSIPLASAYEDEGRFNELDVNNWL